MKEKTIFCKVERDEITLKRCDYQQSDNMCHACMHNKGRKVSKYQEERRCEKK